MFHVKRCMWTALLGLLLAAGSAAAQEVVREAPLGPGEVRLSAPGFEVQGRVLGFDGRFVRIDAPEGELTLDLGSMTCGGACPDQEEFVPELNLSGDADLGRLLLPALIEGFAAAQGWAAERGGEGDRVTYVLREDGGEVLRLGLRLTTTEDGIADLLASEADLAVLARAPRPAEETMLADGGLGEGSLRGARWWRPRDPAKGSGGSRLRRWGRSLRARSRAGPLSGARTCPSAYIWGPRTEPSHRPSRGRCWTLRGASSRPG
jgi:hypothetical protein